MKNLDLIFNLLEYEGTPSNDPADVNKIYTKTSETQILSSSRQQIQIQLATVDQVVSLPDPNSDYLVILTDTQVSVKINGATLPTVLNPRALGTKTLCLFLSGPITSLTISNGSSTIANVDILILNK